MLKAFAGTIKAVAKSVPGIVNQKITPVTALLAMREADEQKRILEVGCNNFLSKVAR